MKKGVYLERSSAPHTNLKAVGWGITGGVAPCKKSVS
jgi:hypothetical protein